VPLSRHPWPWPRRPSRTESEFVEQYVAYNFTAAPRLAASTLTRASMIQFK